MGMYLLYLFLVDQALAGELFVFLVWRNTGGVQGRSIERGSITVKTTTLRQCFGSVLAVFWSI